jgi:predicted glycogen debranching enzyme
MSSPSADTFEWLEVDGLGGFASGTASGVRTRRYHALLLTATSPPGGRVVLVNGLDAWVETLSGSFALTTQRYNPDVLHPDGAKRIVSFVADPWPCWTFRLEDGTELVHELFAPHEASCVVLTWRLLSARAGVRLVARPFLSGRDYHALHRESPAFRFDAEVNGSCVAWQPYGNLPRIVALSNGAYSHEPDWYRNFLYVEERSRGLDDTEDLASPGVFHWDLREEAVLILSSDASFTGPAQRSTVGIASRLRDSERKRRAKFSSRLERAADGYIVRRGSGKTIIAGYPWFTDWGRDTFISLRGLCLSNGRLDVARDILTEWAGTVSQGMLPNRFADGGSEPEFNSVDASLWYVIAVWDLLQSAGRRPRLLSAAERGRLRAAVDAILTGYEQGTRYAIHADGDGLLAAGQPGVQLTWMDAKVGDWVVTPRSGKPVEVQALWLNALRIGATFSSRWKEPLERGERSFRERFWNEQGGYLYDVVDLDHKPGAVDASFRPNQIFAIGGLPFALLEDERARRVVDAVEMRLWTTLGLRSLAPDDPAYVGRYEGGVRERDGAYHQGTVWPWLSGAFIEAWLRVRGNDAKARQEARVRFLEPLLGHLDEAGLGHISEIADGDPPHTPRGCPFQAWSVGEALRIQQLLKTRRQARAA